MKNNLVANNRLFKKSLNLLLVEAQSLGLEQFVTDNISQISSFQVFLDRSQCIQQGTIQDLTGYNAPPG